MSEMKNKYQGWTALSGDNLKAELGRQKTHRETASKNADGRQTNAVFATQDEGFKSACVEASCEATPRQASKFRRKRGLAWRAHLSRQNAANTLA
jgi:hypothetical protein